MSAPARPAGHLGLRARVTAAFAVGALLLSVTLSVLTYGLTRSYLLRQRESSAVRQTYVNARLVRAGLRASEPDVPRLLGSLETPAGSQSVVLHLDAWFASSLAVGRDTLPLELRRTVVEGKPARQRFRVAGGDRLAVGVPIPAVDGAYFEVFELEELERTLRILGTSLAAAAGVTTLAGAGIGRWVSRRALHPLHDVSRAAADIAAGELDTQLDVGGDPDLQELAGSFNAMVAALRARIERDARFASDVSHELRSPLTTISTSLEVLQSRSDELPDRSKQALALLAADVARFTRLVQDLLEISRFDAGAVQLMPEEVRLVELVRRAMPDRRVPVVVGPGGEEAIVLADKRRLERVIANLLENASVHGGGATRVVVDASGGRARFRVEDAGRGVPVSQRGQIFERFARGSAAGQRSLGDGVGLGLSLVAEHVRLHGGRVWVEDAPEGGASFVVELPEAPG